MVSAIPGEQKTGRQIELDRLDNFHEMSHGRLLVISDTVGSAMIMAIREGRFLLYSFVNVVSFSQFLDNIFLNAADEWFEG